MKNFNKPNCPSFGADVTDCFIDDLMDHVKNGKCIVFQRTSPTNIQCMIVESIDSACANDLKPLFHPDDPPTSECYHCYFNLGIPLNGKIHYEFTIDPTDPDLLIWWDHDLGDVTIDSIAAIVDDKPDYPEYEKIADHLYFYWIT